MHAAVCAVWRDVVAKRRALQLHTAPEGCAHRAMQARELACPQLARRRARMDPGAPERLVGVDVPDPGDSALVEKECLDWCSTPFGRPRQPHTRERAGERLGTETCRE